MSMCPHCGKDSAEVIGQPFKNVMERYVNEKGEKAVFNDNAKTFKDGKGVVWQLGKVWVKPVVQSPVSPTPTK